MNIKQNYKKIIGISLIINLIVIMLSVVLVLSQATDTFTISSGVYPSGASWTIWNEGSTYYTKNDYGIIGYYNTNLTLVLQYAVDNLPLPSTWSVLVGRIYINLVGVHYVSGIVTIDGTSSPAHSYILIEGVHPVSTQLRVLGNHPIFLLDEAGSVHFYNLGFGVDVADHATYTSYLIDSTFSSGTTNIQAHNCYFVRGNSIRLNGGAVTLIEGNEFEQVRIGVHIYTATDLGWIIRVKDNYFYGLDDSIGVFIDHTQTQNSRLNEIIGNEFTKYGASTNITGIILRNSSNNIISDNIFTAIDYGIVEDTTSDYNLITNNLVYGIVDAQEFVIIGANTEVYNNLNHATKNSGSVSVATGTAINHGLQSTPTSVVLTMAISEDAWATALSTSQFTVNFDGGGTQTVYWYAEYDHVP